MQNFYGITIDAVEDVYEEKKICLVDCDMSNVAAWRASPLDCKYFFLAPPSLDALEDRLKKSQKYGPRVIEEKMEAAHAEMDEGTTDGVFDQIVYNDRMARSYSEFVRSVSSWYMSADIEPPVLPSDDESGSGASDEKSVKSGASKKSAGSKKSRK